MVYIIIIPAAVLAAVRKHANVYFPLFLFSAFLMKTLGYCRITLRYLKIMAGYFVTINYFKKNLKKVR